MPWKATSSMDERLKFVMERELGDETVAALCRKYDISEKSAYKWLARYKAEGRSGLEERSRAPHTSPDGWSERAVERVLSVRRAHPTWGPKKLLEFVQRRQAVPDLPLPSRSTVAAWLVKHGLVQTQRRPKRAPAYAGPLVEGASPNDLWCTDFKGPIRMRAHLTSNPLTLTDSYSRFLLRCTSLGRGDEPSVRPVFEAAFREYGLPLAIRSDNGPPFASIAVGGLSRLSIWWIKLGIRPERIEPGKPTQNGRHERMHRTLREDLAVHGRPARNHAEQQHRFDFFRETFNNERPHEALGFDSPAQHYQASRRAYPTKLTEPEYDAGTRIRRVSGRGLVKWQGTELYVGETLREENIGLREIDNDQWLLLFGPVQLGIITATGIFRRLKKGEQHVLQPSD